MILARWSAAGAAGVYTTACRLRRVSELASGWLVLEFLESNSLKTVGWIQENVECGCVWHSLAMTLFPAVATCAFVCVRDTVRVCVCLHGSGRVCACNPMHPLHCEFWHCQQRNLPCVLPLPYRQRRWWYGGARHTEVRAAGVVWLAVL
jgi:hypothetical protein